MAKRFVSSAVGRFRAAAAGLLGHAIECLVLVALDAASVPLATPRLGALLAIAIAATFLSPAPAAGPRFAWGQPLALAWLSVGLAHHYLVGIDPLWRGRPVKGVGHLGWDLAFHLPPLVLGAIASMRAVRDPVPQQHEVT